MYKKTLASLTLSLAMTSVALASSNGFYMGVQGGAADINNTADSLGANTATFYSSLPGYESLNNTQVRGPNKTDVDNGNWAARIYGGYQFNRYVAAEAGFTGFAPTQVNNLYGTPIDRPSNRFNGSSVDDTVYQGSVDAVGKLMLPIGSRVNLYAKGGAAYVVTNDFDGQITLLSDSYGLSTQTSYDKNIVTALRPTYGFGASVDLTHKISADISWSQIVGGNNIPTSNFAALGLAYHFK